jgi:molybdopterin converting factor small subunit
MGPFDILAEQHRELEELFEALQAEDGAEASEDQRERTGALLSLLRVHARLEERHLYPLLARVEDRARARQETEDHLTMGELLDELEEQTPGGPEWWARLMALQDLWVAHVREEQEQTFPLLMTELAADEQQELRHALEASREELSPDTRAWMQNPTLLNVPSWDV